MKTNLSIIVPVYNSEKTLKKCLGSLTSQTLKNIEIVIVDDGSTDNSKKIIEHFANIDARIKPIYQGNSGVSKARNAGLEAAVGSYVTFVDSDDWVDAEMYENLYSAASKYDIEVVFSDLLFEYPKSKTKVLKMQIPSNKILQKKDIKEYILPTFLQDGRFGNPIKLYNKEMLEKYEVKFPEDRSLGEDFYFNLEVFTYCESVFYINEPYYHYRQSTDGNSLMKKYRPELFELYFNNSPIEGYFKKWGMYSEEVRIELSRRKCFVAANGCIQNEFKVDCKNSFREKIKVISSVVNHKDVQESASLLLEYEKNKKKKIYLNMLKYKNVFGLYLMGKLLSIR